MDTFGERLSWARKTARERLGLHRGVTQSQLSDAVGVSRKTVHAIEVGRQSKSIKMDTQKAAEVLGVDHLWLIAGTLKQEPEAREEQWDEGGRVRDEDLLELVSCVRGMANQILSNHENGITWKGESLALLKQVCKSLVERE